MSDLLLGTFLTCAICGEYGFSRLHRCAPLWEVRRPEDQAWRQVRAATAERAAEAFAQLTDRWDEDGAVPAVQTIVVRRLGEEALSICEVHGRVQPIYIAQQVAAQLEAR
jgi:hypothetical protein